MRKNSYSRQLLKLKFLFVLLIMVQTFVVEGQLLTITICQGETATLTSSILPPVPPTPAPGIDGQTPCSPGGGAPGPQGCSPTCRWFIEKTILPEEDLVTRSNGFFVVAPITTTTYLISSRYMPGGVPFPGAPPIDPGCQTGQWAPEKFTVIVEECEPANNPIFNMYSWLTDFIDLNDCTGKTVYVYDADGYEFIVLKTDLAELLISSEGKVYCISPKGSFSFVELYDESRILNSWSCEEDLQGKHGTTKGHDQGIQIFPNPAKDKVFINLQKLSFEQTVITIYNVQGKQVLQTSPIDAFAGIAQLDVSNLGRGIYLLQVSSKDDIFTEKLIVK